MRISELVDEVNKAMALELPLGIDANDLERLLSDHINHLIQFDFQKLVFALYRIDVNEEKLKTLLRENPGADAGKIIAELILERQLQKIKTRDQFRSHNVNPGADEAW